jgi:hypothetical protein
VSVFAYYFGFYFRPFRPVNSTSTVFGEVEATHTRLHINAAVSENPVPPLVRGHNQVDFLGKFSGFENLISLSVILRHLEGILRHLNYFFYPLKLLSGGNTGKQNNAL